MQKYFFLHPKYLLTWFGILFLWFLSKLPIIIQNFFGWFFGLFLFLFWRSRVKIVRKNLELCFVNQPYNQKQITKKHFLSLGMSIVELANCLFLSNIKLKKRYSLVGLEFIKKAQKEKRAILLLLGHFTTMLLAGRMLNQEVPITDVYFQQKNKVFDFVIQIMFKKHGATMVNNQDMRGMIKALKTERPLWYAPDQDYGIKPSVFVDFFGVSTATTTATARLTKLTNAVVIPFSYYRVGRKYKLELHSPLENYPQEDEIKNATLTNKILEKQITLAPEQYLWTHKRFKTRPNNEPNPY
ncbi:Lipid A biosynthesis lauroyl acyltransferase [hydrothermal vent metagenome]|uniref:Lipid A biosynthesis lauroyl acyltransferase n=1 Tax=hydrothermal vent metagenome TaxID=652676 RepID=A0A1W1CRN9_9ZZZZ